MENTDEQHGITMPEIISHLNNLGISAERKSIYSDIEALSDYGVEIISEKIGGKTIYYVANRQFELPELKLLVDSVQSAKFITAKKTRELITKIEGLTSVHEAKQLQRQVYVLERPKTMNESIFYNVDKIYSAINSNTQITFQYFQWDVNKNMVLKHDGALYKISPWALSWDDENYYLVAFDSQADRIKHFRVDKMKNIAYTNDLREGKDYFEQFDMALYAKKMFGMFAGEEQLVTLQCKNEFAGVIIDRFGRGVSLIKKDDEHFTVAVKVSVSSQFFAWAFALGDGVKIISPQSVVDKTKAELSKLTRLYE